MTPSDDAFSRIIIGSVVAFGLLALAYFGLFGQRAKVAVLRRLSIIVPTVGAAAIGAAIAFELPLVANVLLWLLGASSVALCVVVVIFARSVRSAFKAKPKT